MAPRNETQTQIWHAFVFSIELFGQGKSIHTLTLFNMFSEIGVNLDPGCFLLLHKEQTRSMLLHLMYLIFF